MIAKTLMVQGTASSVGKSTLVTALCRIYARRGLSVAPFKSQNMALNSAVTPDGSEIGRAQYAQAEAAGAIPSADMNPILLKPERLSTSQVIVLGKPIGSMNFRDYHRRKLELREVVGAALDRLRARHDLVLIEGAGSPAEVNLREHELVNMWVAARAEAPVLLVTDIDRGGALAALVGTLELLDPADRRRVRGLLINKFRGDLSLFADGVRFLEARCDKPVLGVISHMGDTGIASEDSLDLRPRGQTGIEVVAIRLPRLSNFDELEGLARTPGVALQWAEAGADLDRAALVILPGSKATTSDLSWLRRTGLAQALEARARRGGPVLGICGGFQMLGDWISDPEGIESGSAQVPGLGLLPVVTRFEREKITRRVALRLNTGIPLLGAGAGQEVHGYEIHHGRVAVNATARPFGWIDESPEGALSPDLPVAGTLVHGLLENPVLLRALLRGLGVTAEIPLPPDPYEALADHVSQAVDLKRLDEIVGLASS